MTKRIIGYDLARAFAVFGMVVVNFKTVMSAEQNGPPWLERLVGLLDGRAAATFVVLAGVGIALLSGKGRTSGNRDQLVQDRHTLLKRALFLFVVGLLYTPLWPADILHFYGVYIAAAAYLLNASTRRLWTCCAILLLAFVVMMLAMDYSHSWHWKTLTYDGLWTPLGMVRNLFFNGFHPVVPWLAFLLLGMLIGRQDMNDRAVRRRVFMWGAGVALAAEGVSWLLIRTLSPESGLAGQDVVALLGTAPMPPMPLYMLAGAGTASAVIAASVAVGEQYENAAWLRPLVATGQLALTIYVGHVVTGMGALESIGRLEHQPLPFALQAAAVFCAAGVVFAHLWRSRFKRGPLEAIMRTLTEPRRRTA